MLEPDISDSFCDMGGLVKTDAMFGLDNTKVKNFGTGSSCDVQEKYF